MKCSVCGKEMEYLGNFASYKCCGRIEYYRLVTVLGYLIEKIKKRRSEMSDRWCMKCGVEIPLNTSEIYVPEAVNPNPPPRYFELCQKCAEKKRSEK